MPKAKTGLPTIVDVAELAGVSRATASRALSDYGRINAETKASVLDAANKLGYRPNAIARAMRRGSTKTIGLVVVADISSSFFDRVTKAIVDEARAHGFQVLISHTDEAIEVERQAVDTLLQKQVDGLIVVPSAVAVFDHLSPAHLADTPVVLIDRNVEGVRLTSITTDDFSSCDAAVRAAHKNGHKNFGFLIAAPNLKGFSSERPAKMISSVEERINGFANAAIDINAKAKHTWIFSADDPAVSKAAVESLLDQPKPPTIIFTSNNGMALAVLKVVRQRGLRIGVDISLVTVDDSTWAQSMEPGLSVISRPVEEVGTMAVTKLIAEMKSGAKPGEKIVLPTEFIQRGSMRNLKSK